MQQLDNVSRVRALLFGCRSAHFARHFFAQRERGLPLFKKKRQSQLPTLELPLLWHLPVVVQVELEVDTGGLRGKRIGQMSSSKKGFFDTLSDTASSTWESFTNFIAPPGALPPVRFVSLLVC